MGLFSWLNSDKEVIEQLVPFEFYQDGDGIENDYFTVKIDTSIQGHTIKGECYLWAYDDKNEETGRVDCMPFLQALEKLSEKVVPVSIVIKKGKVRKTPVDTDYWADKTGLETFRELDYDLQVDVDGDYLIQ